VSDAAETIWTFRNVKNDIERKTRLALLWELNGDPITDDYVPDEASAAELWDMWLARSAQPVMEIYWFVFSPGQGGGIFEAAPFSRSDPEAEDFLTFFSWPLDENGERLRWTSLPVADKLWRDGRADKGGFIQELTGWKPSPLQRLADVDRLALACGLSAPEPK
jgi:hypothetical protein